MLDCCSDCSIKMFRVDLENQTTEQGALLQPCYQSVNAKWLGATFVASRLNL